MPIELKLLAWSVVLGLVQVVLSGVASSAQNGLSYNMGARDEEKPLTGIPGRVSRALRNFSETFPLFAAAVLLAAVAGRLNATTAWGAQLYFWARLVYVPLYVLGVPAVRSVAWGVAVVGIVLVLVGLL